MTKKIILWPPRWVFFSNPLDRKQIFFSRQPEKGLLKQKDLSNCAKFLCNINKNFEEKLWTANIRFYFDGTSFVHKYNPLDEAQSLQKMAWGEKSEGLDLNYTAKGGHVGSGGRVVLTGLTYSQLPKMRELYCANSSYFSNINRDMFAQFFKDHFKETLKMCQSRKQNFSARWVCKSEH